MANLDLEIYTEFDGVHATITCTNEDEYQAVIKFFKDNGAHVMGISSNVPTAREFVFVEHKEQIQGLGEFVRSLRENEKT